MRESNPHKTESENTGYGDVLNNLHLALFQSLAQVHLIKENNFEIPDLYPVHLSTLFQQTLSFISSEKGCTEELIRKVLINEGPFFALKENNDYLKIFLSCLIAKGYLEMYNENDDLFFVTSKSQRIMSHHNFYPAFQTDSEFNIFTTGNQFLGKMPVSNPYRAGDTLIFNSQAWRINTINEINKTIIVSQAGSGEAPIFAGNPIPPSKEVVETIESLYKNKIVCPINLSGDSEIAFNAGLAHYKSLKLIKNHILEIDDGRSCIIFPWTDMRGLNSLMLGLQYYGLTVSPLKMAILIKDLLNDSTENKLIDRVVKILERIADQKQKLPSNYELARNSHSIKLHKYDHLFSDFLKRWNYASFMIDMNHAKFLAKKIIDNE